MRFIIFFSTRVSFVMTIMSGSRYVYFQGMVGGRLVEISRKEDPSGVRKKESINLLGQAGSNWNEGMQTDDTMVLEY